MLYCYRAKVRRVIDGDTIELEWWDFGLGQRWHYTEARPLRVRFAHVNAYETSLRGGTTPEQKVALNQCLVASSFGVGQAGDPGVLACLTELLGGTVARVAASGLLPLSDEESATLTDKPREPRLITLPQRSRVKSDRVL